MKNYPDSKCVFGYMTLCDECKENAPYWVDTEEPISQYFPAVECEICKRKVNK